MAIYHFTAKVISRSKGRSAVAAAAYRSASHLHDYRQDLTFDYAAKPDVIHSEILAPRETPEWVHNRELLWNAVEAGEKRRDSQVAREVEFALPEELTQPEAIALAREFVEREFVARGMVADLNVHWDKGNPHAHVMLTMRELTPGGFGLKATEWNRRELWHWKIGNRGHGQRCMGGLWVSGARRGPFRHRYRKSGEVVGRRKQDPGLL